MARVSQLTDARLDSLYVAEGFGGETTMRAKVVRELIDEIRLLRRELANDEHRHGAGSTMRERGGEDT